MIKKSKTPKKLNYDFNITKCCEVEYNPGKWARVTDREFRSFNGNRRILNTNNPNNIFYEEYHGPVYLFNTNQISPNTTPGIAYENDIDPRVEYTKKSKW
jgi:hypothetical protein